MGNILAIVCSKYAKKAHVSTFCIHERHCQWREWTGHLKQIKLHCKKINITEMYPGKLPQLIVCLTGCHKSAIEMIG